MPYTNMWPVAQAGTGGLGGLFGNVNPFVIDESGAIGESSPPELQSPLMGRLNSAMQDPMMGFALGLMSRAGGTTGDIGKGLLGGYKVNLAQNRIRLGNLQLENAKRAHKQQMDWETKVRPMVLKGLFDENDSSPRTQALRSIMSQMGPGEIFQAMKPPEPPKMPTDIMEMQALGLPQTAEGFAKYNELKHAGQQPQVVVQNMAGSTKYGPVSPGMMRIFDENGIPKEVPIAGSEPERKRKDISAKWRGYIDHIAELKDYYAKHGAQLRGPDARRMEVKRREVMNDLRALQEMGALQEADLKVLAQQLSELTGIPGVATEYLQTKEGVLAGLDELLKQTEHKAKLKGFGLGEYSSIEDVKKAYESGEFGSGPSAWDRAAAEIRKLQNANR